MTLKIGKMRVALVVLALALSGCAAGPRFQDAIGDIPALAAGQGRIFVYRDFNPLTAFFQRTFTLDGKDVSDIFHETSFYYDTKAGEHAVTYNTPTQSLKFTVPANGVVYLKYTIDGAANADQSTVVEVIPKAQADKEIALTMLVEAKIRVFIPK